MSIFTTIIFVSVAKIWKILIFITHFRNTSILKMEERVAVCAHQNNWRKSEFIIVFYSQHFNIISKGENRKKRKNTPAINAICHLLQTRNSR